MAPNRLNPIRSCNGVYLNTSYNAAFLKGKRVGRVISVTPRGEEWWGEEGGQWGRRGRAGPALERIFLLFISFVFLPCFFPTPKFIILGGSRAKEKGDPIMIYYVRLRSKITNGHVTKPTALAMALWAARSVILNKR